VKIRLGNEEKVAGSVSSRWDERGQSFVEMALSLVFILILLSATVDLGRMFLESVSLREAVQEGSSFATVCPNRTDLIRDRLRGSVSFPVGIAELPDGQITVCIIDPNTGACGGASEIGNNVLVTVTYNHNINTPFVGAFLGSESYPITVSASNVILYTACPF